MKAFVLCGGSIKGAFQAGAISEVIRAGFEPDLICGISVGSLNGAFLTERAGRMVANGGNVDWLALADKLENFWKTRIKKPSNLVRKRHPKKLVEDIVDSKFNGLTRTGPLAKLVVEEIDIANLPHSPIRLKIGAVNLIDARLVYTDTKNPAYASAGYPKFHDHVMASTAIPFAMPFIKINAGVFVDGGVRDIAPIGEALDTGASEIVCIACSPLNRDAFDDDANLGSFMTYANRIQGIITSEILANDLKTIDLINGVLDVIEILEGLFPGDKDRLKSTFAALRRLAGISTKRRVAKPLLITPKFFLNYDILGFTSSDITDMIKLGQKAAEHALDGKTWGD